MIRLYKGCTINKTGLRSATDNTNIFTLAFSKLLLNIYVNGCFKSRAVSVLKSPVSSLANNTKETVLKTWIIELFSCLSKLRRVFWAKDYKHSMTIDNIDLWLKLLHLFSITPPSQSGANTTIIALPEWTIAFPVTQLSHRVWPLCLEILCNSLHCILKINYVYRDTTFRPVNGMMLFWCA